jgi:hypothetical protein
MNKKWVLGRAFRSGRGFYRVDLHGEIKDTFTSSKLIFGIPRYQIREILTQFLSVVWAKLTGDERDVFVNRWRLEYLAGQAYEARLLCRDIKPPQNQQPRGNDVPSLPGTGNDISPRK